MPEYFKIRADALDGRACEWLANAAVIMIVRPSASASRPCLRPGCLLQKALLMTPPSTRSAAPVVAEDSGLAT